MTGLLEFWLNAVMVVLLTATVFYCWLLNKRIQVLQDSKSELANLLKQFDRSTKRATEAMDLLQHASKEAGKSIQARVEKAQYVLDDLDYMMDRADKIAEQMEAGLAIARQRNKLEHQAVPSKRKAKPSVQLASPQPSEVVSEESFEQTSVTQIAATHATTKPAEIFSFEEDTVVSDVTRDAILQSLRQAKAGGKQSESAISSLTSLIDKVAKRQNDRVLRSEASATSQREQATRLPSRGERELLKALHAQAE